MPADYHVGELSDIDRRLRDLNLRVFYDEPGSELAQHVLLPALGVSRRYDRVSAYFNLNSLVSIGAGLEKLYANSGRMRLLMGAHDADLEIASAAATSRSEELISRLRSRIVAGVSSLSSELERNRVEAAAWMIHEGFLEIRLVVANPMSGQSGIFHNKRLIFVDKAGDVVTATGSVNETAAGLGGNFEELTLHASWDAPEHTMAHVSRFETVWLGEEPRLATIPLDTHFAQELLTALGSHHAPGTRSLADGKMVVDVLSRSPFLGVLNSSRSPLYPHQERALKAVCSRWPIRALLADEVGLGKTYEAAAAVSFALQYAGVDRVVVLAPPTLLRQWQDEFVGGFGLPFWRYESTLRAYVAPDGSQRSVPDGPFAGDYPNRVIVSRDLARGTRKSGHAFERATTYPDLLVLDEAHVVRKRRSSTEVRPSLIGRMMQDVLEKVPHAIFLTATPLQTDASELYDVLELLGVPTTFDGTSYLRSLELLAIGEDSGPELDQVAGALDLVRSLILGYRLTSLDLPLQLNGPVTERMESVGLIKELRLAQKQWPALKETLVRVHPAAQLCVRNTRETLTRIGYTFPSRRFRGVNCRPTPQVEIVLRRLDEYLGTTLGRVEAELYPNRRTAVGFVRSTYHQRAASSLSAVHASLDRRLKRLVQLRDGLSETDEFVEEDTLDEGSPPAIDMVDPVDAQALKHACATEILDIEALLSSFEGLEPDVGKADPKLDDALRVINELQRAGRKVLVFSRYTDTVYALTTRFVEAADGRTSYASYTGDGGLLNDGGMITRGDKALVTRALSEGVVDVVFCSDAASEGLNLQAASAIVNVDVPWNPARLEQRIGRVARIGQVAESVDIVNLWYPRSVEARIYERVLHRKDMMDLALGMFPEIVGNAIREAVSAASPIVDRDVIAELNERRNAMELDAITNMWSAISRDNGLGYSSELRGAVSLVLDEIAVARGPSISGRRPTSQGRPFDPLLGPVLTLHEDWIKWLASTPTSMGGSAGQGELGVLMRGSKVLTFALREGSWIKALAPSAIPDVLRTIYLEASPDLNAHVFAEVRVGESLDLAGGAALRPWWPDFEALTVPVGDLRGAPAIPDWARSSMPVAFEPLMVTQH